MSSHNNSNMTCGFKLDTQSPGWHRTFNKVLKKIKGANYSINAEEGMAYITGRVEPGKVLKKIGKAKKHAELAWIETGNQNMMMNQQYPYANHSYPYANHGYPHLNHGYHYSAPGYAINNYYPPGIPYPNYGYAYHSGYGYGGYNYPTWG